MVLAAAEIERCLREAEQIRDLEGFKAWTRGAVRSLLPHGALACGHGRIHSAGVSMDYVVTVDYPVGHLKAIANSSGCIDTPLMRRWLATRSPVFFDGAAPWDGTDERWLAHFRQHDLRNTAADAVFDEAACIGTYFSFHRLPDLEPGRLTAAFAALTPALHETLMRVVRHHEATQHAAAPLRVIWPMLTEREEEMALWVSQGKSNAEIAMLTGLSPHTVKNHLRNVMEKLGCSNRAGLAAAVATRMRGEAPGGPKML